MKKKIICVLAWILVAIPVVYIIVVNSRKFDKVDKSEVVSSKKRIKELHEKVTDFLDNNPPSPVYKD